MRRSTLRADARTVARQVDSAYNSRLLYLPAHPAFSTMNSMKLTPTLLATTLLLTWSVNLHAQNSKPDSNVLAAERPLHILEQADWQPLLNGKDLSGWEGDTEGYVYEGDVLVCRKGAKNLQTKKVYADFALQFDFKLEESGNNGVGIRVPAGKHPASDGLELQILDHHGSRYVGEATMADGKKRTLSWLKPWQYHGSVYGIVPAKTGYLKPVGEWNTETIVAIDDHIMVILNGAVIVDAFLDDVIPPTGNPHAGSQRKEGHIVLAGHNDRVEFRNLKLADYSRPPTSAKTDVNVPPEGFETLFNGQDLSGWKGLAHRNANDRRALKGDALKEAQAKADQVMAEHWSVQDGILTYDGTGQSLCTAKDFGDFDLYVDWKIPPGADSGIYLRGTPQIQIWDPWDPRVKQGQDPPAAAEQWVAAYRNGRNLGSGGLWNNKRWRNSPTQLADNKPGEWNTFLIRMVGEKVSIWLNDKQIVDRVKLENYWDKTGTIPIPRADQIELQHHGSALYFRNLFIRELPY